MHRGVKYYREGWNAWYKGRASAGDVPYPVIEQYQKQSWLAGFWDAKQVEKLTGNSGAFWGRQYIPEPEATKVNLAIALFGLVIIIGLSIIAWTA